MNDIIYGPLNSFPLSKEMIDSGNELTKSNAIDKLQRTSLISISKDYKTMWLTFPFKSQYPLRTGELLINFIELDYYSFLMRYRFIFDYFGSYIETMLLTEYQGLQKIFKEIMDVCFSNNQSSKNIYKKFSEYQKQNSNLEENLNINLRLSIVCYGDSDLSLDFSEHYWFTSLTEILYLELINSIRKKIIIKQCHCCEKYFIPEGRKDIKTCLRIAPEPNPQKKTCREIGATRKHQKVIKSNPVYKEFYKEYKKRFSWKDYGRKINGKEYDQDDFDKWNYEASLKRDEYLNNPNGLEQFINWQKQYNEKNGIPKRKKVK